MVVLGPIFTTAYPGIIVIVLDVIVAYRIEANKSLTGLLSVAARL